jgi:hypothetical protein
LNTWGAREDARAKMMRLLSDAFCFSRPAQAFLFHHYPFALMFCKTRMNVYGYLKHTIKIRARTVIRRASFALVEPGTCLGRSAESRFVCEHNDE